MASSSKADYFYKILFLSIISVVLIVLDLRIEGLKVIRNLINHTATPMHLALDWTAAQQKSLSLFFDRGLETRNAMIELERENLILKQRLPELESLKRDNDNLRQMLSYGSYYNETTYVTAIVGGSLNSMTKELLLDRGRQDGIRESMVVSVADGLLGQVIGVGLSSSKLLLITDPRHSTPVQVARNDNRFIIDGTGENNRLRAQDIHADIDVEVGDILVTSGWGGVFPANIPVARVTEVFERPGESMRRLHAMPLARGYITDFALIREGLANRGLDSNSL